MADLGASIDCLDWGESPLVVDAERQQQLPSLFRAFQPDPPDRYETLARYRAFEAQSTSFSRNPATTILSFRFSTFP